MASPTVAAVHDARISRAADLLALATVVFALTVFGSLLAEQRGAGLHAFGMKANAAVVIALSGTALLALGRHRVWSGLLATLALAIGLLTLAQHVAQLDFGIDQMLVNDRPGAIGNGRMAWETAAALSLIAFGTLLAGRERHSSARRLWRGSATVVAVSALFVVLAYLFRASVFRELGSAVRMAPETASAILCLSCSLLLHRIGDGWPRLLFSDSPAGRLVRRFIPASVAVAFLVGWFRSRAETQGLLDHETGIAVSVTANVLILVALVVWWGRRLEQDHRRLQERDEALTASDERFRLVAMATNDAVYDWDIAGDIRTWNNAIADRYDHPTVDSGLDGAEWIARVHPDDRERVSRGWNAAVETGERLWRCEYRALRPDGTVDDLLERTFIVRDADGTAVRAIGAITELTAIRRAEALLRDANAELERRVAERTEDLAASNLNLRAEIKQREEAERELRRERDFTEALFEASAAVFIVIDRDLKVARLNHAGQKATGYTAEEVIGKSVIELFVPPENREALAELGAAMLAGDMGDQLVIEWLTRTGERRTMSWATSPLPAEDGSVEYLLGAGVDITSEHEAQEELRQKTERLAAINAELEAFSYSVSHDLRAPLRSIDGFSQALIEDNEPQLDDTGRSHLRRIRAATQKMGELIDGLLELSRVSRTSLESGNVDLSAIAAQTVERLHEQEPSRNVDVSIEPSIVVQGDARLLRIVMENLLENAWKFTSRTNAASIQVGRNGHAGDTEVFVRDNGAGFDPQYASKIFGAFQRLHPATEFPGTGIGLATVQRIVARHGGVVRAEGAPGRGATFSFTIGGPSS